MKKGSSIITSIFSCPKTTTFRTKAQNTPQKNGATTLGFVPEENQSRDSIRLDLMVDHWAKLLAHGCSEQEPGSLDIRYLFNRMCPREVGGLGDLLKLLVVLLLHGCLNGIIDIYRFIV